MAESLRIATYNAGLVRNGPGLLLRDILKPDDPQIAAAVQVVATLDADVVVLTAVDYDFGLVALSAFADRLAAAGAPYPYRFALRPNTGLSTGLDLDGNGSLGDARDAQGYGRFAGQAGMAVLSRLPIAAAAARDYSGFLWRDLPGALLPKPFPGAAVQRLSTTGHWQVPVTLPGGQNLSLLIWYATPPVFDGPEDSNGRRNHDEAAFWVRLIDGALPFPTPAPPFIVLGDANLDPLDGDGLTAGIAGLLTHPALQDPGPRGTSGRVDVGQRGDAALDTADYTANAGPGGLRVDYVLPSVDLKVTASGVVWPTETDPLAATLAAASRHRPVWVEITLP